MAFEVTDLPEPDSPTIASVSQRINSKLIPRIALKIPCCVLNEIIKSLTSNIFSIILPPLLVMG